MLSMFESSVNSDGTQTLFSADLIMTGLESSANSDGTQTLRQRRRAAAVPIDLQTAVRTAVQLLREQWLCRFFCFRQIFFIFCYGKKKEKVL